eukprot:8631540-Alexandrium_andersonii.AAC.1
MSASLVGSEMCIRDSVGQLFVALAIQRDAGDAPAHRGLGGPSRRRRSPVSYTHLTLPTICSV